MPNQPRVIVVTGASAGVGRACARAFAAEGARLGLIARGRAGLEATAREVREAGGEALVLPCDVADADAVERAAAEVEERFGPLDVWVNAAMTAVLAEVTDTSAEEFRRVTDVTYLGSVHGMQAALRRMVPRDHGTIVQVGSALARRGIPLQASYCAAKHAVQGFIESLRTELVHSNSKVHVAIVQLPGIDTTQFGWVRARTSGRPRPVAPVYKPEVAARAIVWASKHRRRELWVGLPTYYTIIGNFLAPSVEDLYLGKAGVEGQQADARLDPDRPDYLFAPLDDEVDRGMRGTFDSEAKGRSPMLELTMRRRAIGAGAAALAATAVGVAVARR